MSDSPHAFWRRLDRPGHDAARLLRAYGGWTLDGYAAFDEHGPTGLHYRIRLAHDFSTVSATIDGHRAGGAISHAFYRDAEGWRFNGAAVPGLKDILHIDFGFTPAPNFHQLRHAALVVGGEAEFDVAWFDVGEAGLVRLPQRYRRIADDRYWYSSPASGYEAVLKLAPNGFVRLYPDLWEMDPLNG